MTRRNRGDTSVSTGRSKYQLLAGLVMGAQTSLRTKRVRINIVERVSLSDSKLSLRTYEYSRQSGRTLPYPIRAYSLVRR